MTAEFSSGAPAGSFPHAGLTETVGRGDPAGTTERGVRADTACTGQSARFDRISRGKEVIAVEIEGLRQVMANIGPEFARAVDILASVKGRVIVSGIGKSGLVGRKIAATLSSTGTPAFFMHPVEGAHGDLGSVQPGDAVIALSYSGKSAELNAILPVLRSLGASIIAITSDMESPSAKLADVVLNVSIPREACPMNLAPTSSTTATLALGDALAVCLIEMKQFTRNDFKRYHPAGALGERLRLSVFDIMCTEDIPTVSENASRHDALTALDRGGFGAVLVLDAQGAVTGILTDGDVRRAVCRGDFQRDGSVSEIMTKNPRSARTDQSAAELIDIMEEKKITVLPVTDASRRLLGVVHMHDLLGKGKVRFAE